MEKVVIIINGNGGVGKDTLCDFAGKRYRVTNISAITPIKEIAERYGWHGEKDAKSRKFLADLKKTFVEYNDLPYEYLKREYEKFLHDNSEILFVHIREGNEIEKFRQYVTVPCVTLLIKRECVLQSWGNSSDDNVEDYDYDYTYHNDKTLRQAPNDFGKLVDNILRDVLKKRSKNNYEISNYLFPQNRLESTISNWHIQNKKLLQKGI